MAELNSAPEPRVKGVGLKKFFPILLLGIILAAVWISSRI